MSTKDKLIERFKRLPKDFTWEELVRVFAIYGYVLDSKGKTSGSRAIFSNGRDAHVIHKPHPSNIVKSYALKQVYDFLIKNNTII